MSIERSSTSRTHESRYSRWWKARKSGTPRITGESPGLLSQSQHTLNRTRSLPVGIASKTYWKQRLPEVKETTVSTRKRTSRDRPLDH